MGKRRNTELWLLIAAAPALLLLFLMLLVNGGQPITVASFAVPIGLIVAFFAAHAATRRFAPAADPGLLPVVFLLAGIGICFVLRLADDAAALRQVVWLFAGVILMIATIVAVPSIEKLAEFKYTTLLLGIVLLLLPCMPLIGAEYNGSRIWLSIAGFSFQPGELAKICIVLFLAAYLADHREMLSTLRRTRSGIKLPDFGTALPLVAMWAVAMLVIIFEKDLGSALLLYGVFLAMLYVCTGRISYVIFGIVLMAIGGTALYFVFSHVQTRIAIWLDPFADRDAGYQLIQSLFSLADGGLFGSGIGRGLPTYIPEVASDFIFSAIGEEMGLLGASAVIILFVLFAIRGFATAARAKSDVAAFVAAGLTVSISLQAFIIVGGVTGFIPLTGITLPFMSQGGSSLIASFIIVGLLLRAGDEGTGLSSELTGTVQIKRSDLQKGQESGVLGRVMLGSRLTKLVTLIAVLFALLIANLTWVQIVRADSLRGMESNNHTLTRQALSERGAIITCDGVTLAESVKGDDGAYRRVYPQGSTAAQLVGYYSQRYGTSGVEATMSSTLVGEEHFSSLEDVIASAAGLETTANDVVLTVDSEVQQAAQNALAGKVGACVVLDTKTGAVLAEASSPTYDINDVASLLDGTTSSTSLINRACGALYAPGSTFKAITLAAALDTGQVTADTMVDSPSSITIGGAPITTHRNSGSITVAQATAISSNTAFAQIAVKLGADNLVAYSKEFGIGVDGFGQDFPLTTSLMPDPREMTEWELAWAGDGQPVGEHASPAGPQVTVMQMAVAMAAISNDGAVMRPYVVDHVLSSAGKVVDRTSPATAGQAVSPATARAEQEILRGVVEHGTGMAAQIDGVDVIGKTGTAQVSASSDNAWFIGTASSGGRSVTIAMVVEDAPDEGGVVVAPLARDILATALQRMGG